LPTRPWSTCSACASPGSAPGPWTGRAPGRHRRPLLTADFTRTALYRARARLCGVALTGGKPQLRLGIEVAEPLVDVAANEHIRAVLLSPDEGSPSSATAAPQRQWPDMLVVALAAGALIGLSLGALAAGGSILTVPVLVHALRQARREATTASLIIVGITSITASLNHTRAGHVRWTVAAAFGLVGVAASIGGSTLNRHLNPQILLLTFAALMLAAAAAMYARAQRTTAVDTADSSSNADSARTSVSLCTSRVVAVAVLVGFLTGLLHVGGGFLIVPALVLSTGYAMPMAVGTSLVIISITSLAAFLERLGNSLTPWHVVVPFALAAITGSLVGKRLADRLTGDTLIRALAALLVAVACYVAIRADAQL